MAGSGAGEDKDTGRVRPRAFYGAHLLWTLLLEVSERSPCGRGEGGLPRAHSCPFSLCLGKRLHQLHVPRLTPYTGLLHLGFQEWPVARMKREARSGRAHA